MQTSDPNSQSLRLFQVQNGLVISDTGQQDADDFAADFQGLRHFADRVGGTLDLGTSHYSSLHEPDFSFMYLLPQNAGSPPSRASGAMISGFVGNTELLIALRERNS
jgi:hypothetical protein